MRAKSLGKTFGETRDLDVFADELFSAVETAAPNRAGMAELRGLVDAARSDSWRRCSAHASSGEFTRFLLDLAAAAETRVWRQGVEPMQIATFVQPAEEFARVVLDKRNRKARKRARRLADLNTSQRHRLRIALKKLRYAAEFFFAPLFAAKHVTRYLKKLSKTQDVFGAMNDAATAKDVLEHILVNTVPGPNSALREATGFVEGWHFARIETAWKDARARWKRLEKSKPFWTA